ncbi:hypothetical protein D3C86_2191380 [compost metagenome]
MGASDRPADVRRRMGEAMASALATLDERLKVSERAGFQPLIEGAPSVNKRREARLVRAGKLPMEAARNG